MVSSAIQEVLLAKLNIDVLPHILGGKVEGIGVRVRPYGKRANVQAMILGYGKTFTEALEDVYAHAQAGRWEALDWSARPWAQATTGSFDPIWDGPEIA